MFSSRPLGPAARITRATNFEAGPNMLSGGPTSCSWVVEVKLRMWVGARLQGEEFTVGFWGAGH